MQWSTWPEITDNASPTTPASTFDSMAVTIPLLILLIVILAVLLSIIIIRYGKHSFGVVRATQNDFCDSPLRKPCAEKHKGDISSYDIRKQSDNSPIAREYGTIENEYENVDKIKPGHSDEKQVVYNAIYETSS